ncbi:MAG TPA: hypothetical protein VGS22_16855 [Thermoanaerobaculia bacterium]|jgi:hypothetical protein|nr:hypothetical protein [Thermoanaerobaculia bacterium]
MSMTLGELHKKMFKKSARMKKNYTVTPSGQVFVDLDAVFQDEKTRQRLIDISKLAHPAK